MGFSILTLAGTRCVMNVPRCLGVRVWRRSLLCPHIPGGFQVEWMPIPYGFHPFHMEYFWLTAQPFWCKFPCSFHMETLWNFNIPWNISLESRWNPSQFIPWNPWTPWYSTSFYMDSILFHIIPYGFHIESQTIIKYSPWGHQTNNVFCSVHWVRSHDFPKQLKYLNIWLLK